MKSRLICLATLLVAGVQQIAGGQQAPVVAPDGQAAVAADVVDVPEPLAVAANVEQALRGEENLAAEKVVVSTHARTIVLTGVVGSDTQAARVVSVANGAAQGLHVESRLEVQPGEPAIRQRQAVALVRDVERALGEDPRTADLGVAVSIDDEQVIGLHGLVPSVHGRRAAEEVAAEVDGVTRLRSHLIVPGE